jgi:hypothetical protein
MNPTSRENSRLNLPQPVEEADLPSLVAPEAPNFTQNSTAAAFENKQGYVLPPMPQMPVMLANPVIPSSVPVVAISTNSVVPITPDDSDLIEIEWVNKAKKIIENNRDDPHNQSIELTLVKADYLKQHYNKSIKLSEQ